MKFLLALCLLIAASHSARGQRARFEPADGFVYHGVQTAYGGADGYIAALNDCALNPYVRGLFIAIPGPRDPGLSLRGLRQHLRNADSLGFFPEFNISLCTSSGSPNGAQDSVMAESSRYDPLLDTVAIICKEYGRRVLVRIGGEFNGIWNGGGYKPHYYPKTFRKIVEMFAARGARDSAAFVWCYEPDAPDNFDASDAQGDWYYPGDGYVDWFGLDVFDAEHFNQTLPDSIRGAITRKGKSERFLRMAREHGKPVFLNETSAKGVTITADSLDSGNDWRNWFAPFGDFLSAHPEIKGFMYTNQDWENTGYPGWGDARIQNSPFIVQKYTEEIRKPKYIHLPCTAAGVERDEAAPAALRIGSYPNPFRDRATIRISAAGLRAGAPAAIRGSIEIVFYDLLGREAARREVPDPGSGEREFTFEAGSLPAGAYIFRVNTGGALLSGRCLLYK